MPTSNQSIDHSSFFEKGKKPPARADPATHIAKWWELEPDDAAESITQSINFLKSHQDTRLSRLSFDAKLYGNMAFGTFPFGWAYSPVSNILKSFINDRMTFNIVQSCIDTVVAKMAKNRPAALYTVSGGDYKKRRRAQRMNRFSQALFNEVKAYELGPLIFRDCCIFGDGYIAIYEKNGRVAWERMLPHEIWVDQIEGLYGQPLTLHRVKVMDKDVAIANWPDKEELIVQSQNTRAIDGGVFPTLSDAIPVRESWRLPTSLDADDGAHIITIPEGALTEKMPWKHMYFPIARMQWNPSIFGWYGTSVGQQLQSIQLEINKILSTIQRSFHLMGSFKIWKKTGSKIVPGQLNNDIGTIIESIEKPEYIVPPNIVPPEIYQHLQTLIQRGYEEVGVSMLSAASQKPQGLNAAVALREMSDIESDRFTRQGHGYEQLFMDADEISLGVVRDVFERTGEYKISASEGAFADELDWKDIRLAEKDFIRDTFPVSSLPNTPEGRMQTITEMVQAGWITPRSGKRMMALPDLQQEQTLSDAREDWIHEILEKIIEDGEYIAPEVYDDLQLARELALQEYATGKCHGLEEEKLELIRKVLSQLDVYDQQAQQQAMAQAQAQQAATAPPGGGPPQAPPVPPAASPMVPNVPQNGAMIQ